MQRESQVAPLDESTAGRDMSTTRPSERALRSSTWVLAAVVIAAPLAIGGARPDHQLWLSFAAVAAFCFTAWTRVGHRMRFRWPLWPFAALCVLGVVQLVPLPVSLIAALSPRAHEIFGFTLGDLGLYGPDVGHALSVDPPSTLLATVHQVAFLGVAWAAAEVPRGFRRHLENALVYGPALVAVIGFVHLALGFSTIYGFYAPLNGSPLRGYFSTFVNNNTLAALLALGALVGLGQAADTDDTAAQRRSLTAAALCTAGVFFSASRGGQLALLVGLACFTVFAHLPGPDAGDARHERSRSLSRVGMLLAVVGLAMAVMLLPDWSRTPWQNLGAENKFAAWPAAVDYAGDFPLVGSGRGTFAVTYPLFQSLRMPSLVSHPENIVLQFLCEWGVLGALLALGGGVVAWLASARAAAETEARPRHWGLLAGLAAVGLAQLADFGLEAAGLALPTAAAFGLCVARVRRVRRPATWLRARLPLFAGVGGVLALALVAWRGPVALAALPDRAIAELAAAPAEPEAILRVATSTAPQHPADAFFALKTAQRLVAAHDADLQRVMRWLNRALFLAPNGGEARLLAARVLARRGLWAQAADEYRAAMEVLPWELIPLIREVVARFPEPELVVRATAQTPEHRRALGNRLLTERSNTFARDAIRIMEDTTPDDPDLIGLRARACLALADLACVRGAADALEKAGRPLFAATLRARVALREARPDDARALLEGVRALGAHDRDFLRSAATLYRDLGDLKTTREYLDKLWPLVALEPRQAASVLAQRAWAEMRLGDAKLALVGFERAWRMHPAKAYAQGLRSAARKTGHPEAADAILRDHPQGGIDDPDASEPEPSATTTD